MVLKENVGIFLIDFLKNNKEFVKYSFSKICKEIKQGQIKVNNKKVTTHYLLKEKDEIHIYTRIKKMDNFILAKDDIDIFYEDNNIMIVNKPINLLCQKNKKNNFDYLNNRIKKYLFSKKDFSYKEAHLLHRLDKNTKGLCLAAKKKDVFRIITKVWHTNQVRKFYKALSFGYFFKKEEILKSFYFDKKNFSYKASVLSYKVIKQFKNYALLDIEIKTGRKHQIRRQLSEIGHPILGDKKYNKINLLNYKLPCLFSYKLLFNFKSDFKNILYLNNKTFELKKISFNEML